MATATLHPPLPVWAVAPLASGVMGLAFVVAYPLSDRTEPAGEAVAWPAVYPSAAINYPPSANVGSFIISLACVLMAWAFAVRHAENAARLELGAGERGTLELVNGAATVAAVAGMVVGPLGVCAAPWHEYETVHFAFAYGVFYLGAAYLVMQSYLDSVRPERVAAPLRIARLALVGVGTAAMFSYWLGFGVVGEHHPGSNASTAAEALLELLCMIILLLFVASFGLSQTQLRLEVRAELQDSWRDAAGKLPPTASTPLLGTKPSPGFGVA